MDRNLTLIEGEVRRLRSILQSSETYEADYAGLLKRQRIDVDKIELIVDSTLTSSAALTLLENNHYTQFSVSSGTTEYDGVTVGWLITGELEFDWFKVPVYIFSAVANKYDSYLWFFTDTLGTKNYLQRLAESQSYTLNENGLIRDSDDVVLAVTAGDIYTELNAVYSGPDFET